MRLKYLALTSLLTFTAAISSPPRLGWEYGWCWDNALVQLLYNMRGLTECLIKNAGECRQKNRVLEKYIDLITAIRKNPDGYFLEEMRAYHAAYCGAQGCATCAFGVLEIAIGRFLQDYFFCCRDLFEVKLRLPESTEENFGTYDLLDFEMLRGGTGIGNWVIDNIETGAGHLSEGSLVDGIGNWILDDTETGLGHFCVGNIPEYLFFIPPSYWKVINERIDLAPRLSAKLKKLYPTCLYDLIGVGLQGTHVTAYIKDQWSDNPSWYYCDDMAARNLASHKKLDKWPESGPWPGEYLALLVYKRVDSVGQNKPQVTSDDKDLEKLVQALRDLV